jgi:transposase
MGGSSLSFALATWTEQFPDWIAGNNAAFAFFRGVPGCVTRGMEIHSGRDR